MNVTLQNMNTFLNSKLIYFLSLKADTFVARRKAHTESNADHHHHHGGVNYNVGRYASNIGLGKVILPVNNVEKVSRSLKKK